MECRHRLFALAAAGAYAEPVDPHSAAALDDALPDQDGVMPELIDAVGVVEAFTVASASGQPEVAAQWLDAGVVVVVDGRMAGLHADYLALRAGDAPASPPPVERRLRHRHARAVGALAWVVSEFAVEPCDALQCRIEHETVVLARAPGGWRILHLHRSTRTA